MFYKKYADWLIPVLALLVIFQAVALLSEKTVVKQTTPLPYLPLTEVELAQEAVVELAFVPSGVSIRKGESMTVDVFLTPKKALQLDGVDLALEFVPEALQITQINTPKVFSLVSQKRENEKDGRIYVTFLEEKAGGLAINTPVKLATLTLKGKTVGESTISILTAAKGPSTVITESGTSKKISFDKGSLRVAIY